MKKEAIVKLVSGTTYQFQVQKIELSESFFTAFGLRCNLHEPFYLEIKHEQLNSSIDLTHLKDTLVLHFDADGMVLGATFVLPKSSGSFGIVTQSKRLLFLPYPVSFIADDVVCVEIA